MEQPDNSSTQVLDEKTDEKTDETTSRAKRRVKQGRVASNKMEKTIVVVAETRVRHPVYGKIVRKSNTCVEEFSGCSMLGLR